MKKFKVFPVSGSFHEMNLHYRVKKRTWGVFYTKEWIGGGRIHENLEDALKRCKDLNDFWTEI